MEASPIAVSARNRHKRDGMMGKWSLSASLSGAEERRELRSYLRERLI
jgi:hypothetical protein